MDEATNKTSTCGLCAKPQAKYSCPKCNIQYCSVECYRSEAHGQCSEAFYRDCVLSELGSEDADPQTRAKMLEMLSRLRNSELETEYNELDSDDESEELDLADRLQGIDLDDADSVWDKLTDKEKEEFEELLRTGDVTKIFSTWEPWWYYRVKKKVIQDLDSVEETDDSYKKRCPAVDESIQPLSKMTKVKPSANVMWNLANVLSSYVITVRIYNGEHESYTQEAANMLIALSSNLSLNQNFDDFNLAVTAARQEAINAPWITAEVVDEIQLRQDLENICIGPMETKNNFYVLAALCDIHRLFSRSKSAKKDSKSKPDGEFSRRFPDASCKHTIPQVTKDKLKGCIRKIEFYQSWAKEYM